MDLARGELAPVDREALRDPGAQVRIADHLARPASQPARELHVERGRQRVARHQQLAQRAAAAPASRRCRRGRRRRRDRRQRAGGGAGPARRRRTRRAAAAPRPATATRSRRARCRPAAAGRRASPPAFRRAAPGPGPRPGSSARPRSRIDAPSNSTSSSAASRIAAIPSRARKQRRPCSSKRFIRLSSVGGASEAEVDERGDALGGHGGADDGDRARRSRPRARAGGPARAGTGTARPDATAAAAGRSRRRSPPRWPGSTASPRRATQARQERAGHARSSERNRIQPKTTRWNVTAQRSHAGVRIRPPSACSATRPRPWNVPQATNVHAAPCHRPPSIIVIIRLRYVNSRPPRLPPSGM